jgi:hypothetical protein
MLRTLTHAKDLLFGDEKAEAAAHPDPQGDGPAVAVTGPQGGAPSAALASAPEPDAQPEAPDSAGSSKS